MSKWKALKIKLIEIFTLEGSDIKMSALLKMVGEETITNLQHKKFKLILKGILVMNILNALLQITRF